MQYRIVRERSLEDLEQEVNAALAEGWVPTGGPMNLPFGFAGYFQAMVREGLLDHDGPTALVRNLPLLDARELVMQDPGDRPDLAITEVGNMVTMLD